MQRKGLQPNAITYSTAFSAHEEAEQPDMQPSMHVRRNAASRVVVLLAETLQKGLEPNAITYSTAISAYDKAKQPDKVLELLAGTVQRGQNQT